ncbi:MAG: hypothetical protein ABIQ12_12265 [Opitutaceae bacterium]
MAAAALWLYSTGRLSLKEISDSIAGLSSILVIGLMAVLPLAGFSIAIVYLVVGAKFGPVLGLPLVIGLTAFHLLASYWISRSFLRGPVERLLTRRGHHLPHILPGEHAGVCLLAVLVPGLPYFARNYLLALTEVKLRVYFWVCLPAYVARSYVAIMIGDLSHDPDASQFALLVAIYGLKLALCACIVWRLRRHRHPHRAAAGAAH